MPEKSESPDNPLKIYAVMKAAMKAAKAVELYSASQGHEIRTFTDWVLEYIDMRGDRDKYARLGILQKKEEEEVINSFKIHNFKFYTSLMKEHIKKASNSFEEHSEFRKSLGLPLDPIFGNSVIELKKILSELLETGNNIENFVKLFETREKLFKEFEKRYKEFDQSVGNDVIREQVFRASRLKIRNLNRDLNYNPIIEPNDYLQKINSSLKLLNILSDNMNKSPTNIAFIKCSNEFNQEVMKLNSLIVSARSKQAENPQRELLLSSQSKPIPDKPGSLKEMASPNPDNDRPYGGDRYGGNDPDFF